MKDIPLPSVPSSEHHLAGILSKPLNYKQMLNMLENCLNSSVSSLKNISNILIQNLNALPG